MSTTPDNITPDMSLQEVLKVINKRISDILPNLTMEQYRELAAVMEDGQLFLDCIDSEQKEFLHYWNGDFLIDCTPEA
jgi:hypothetical protein